MEKLVMNAFKVLSLVLIAILVCYFWVFRGGISLNQNDWGSFGSLIGGLSMLLFSLANIKIWMYQSRMNNEAMKNQVKLQERLTLLTGLQSKLLFVSKPHGSYEYFQQVCRDTHQELERWQFGIYEHIFDNDETLIAEAFNTLDGIDHTWMSYGEYCTDSNDLVIDGYNPRFQKRLRELEEPLLALIKHYRKQIT